MNILLLIGTLGLGGAEKQLVEWANILQTDLGYRVHVVSFDSVFTERVEALHSLEVPVTVLGRTHTFIDRVRGTVSLARKNRVDVVHAFTCYLSPLAVLCAATASATPAASFRGDGLADIRAIASIARRPTLAALRYFTANSREAIDRARPHISPKALVQYVPNLVSAAERGAGEERRNTGGRGRTALMIGRLDDNKRVGVFLEALAAARKTEPDLRGVIVGEGGLLDGLRRRAEHLGLPPDAVAFPGKLPDVSDYYKEADVFVHLAASEGTPNVVLEAMAAGLPVIATEAGDLRHVVRHRQTGIIVPVDDAQAVTEALLELGRSPGLALRLGERARTEVLETYSAERVKSALEHFYSEIHLRKRS